MNYCSKEYSASQFAILSSIITLPRIFIGPLAGFVAESYGWTIFFFLSFVLSIPSVILTLNLNSANIDPVEA
jgi:PAT family beta-lactamase induction signal transducer AmpG